MREISVDEIIEKIEKISIKANFELNEDILRGLKDGIKKEESVIGKEVINQLIKNAQCAKEKQVAICQDTGMAIVFIEMGQDLHVVGGNITDAINEGIRRGYKAGYLRNSVVNDPIHRTNTEDNTPAVIHYDIVPGEGIKIIVAPKGFGSENVSRLKMLKPSDGLCGVKDFVLETVDLAGPNPCPPIVVGVGIGGSFEKCAFLSKWALVRSIDIRNSVPYLAELESELLAKINELGIGPAGLGGRITALAVNIETYPTHIAGLPVAVNISCHATRHMEVIL